MPSRRRIAFVLLSVAFSLALVESVLWIVEMPSRPPRASDGYAFEFVASDGRTPITNNRGPLKLVHDPFVTYRNLPNQQHDWFEINSQGYRGAELDPSGSKPRIVIVGGSTAFGDGVESDADTFAAALGGMLPDLEVINAAVVGHVSTDELALLRMELLDLHPALVIALDGFNDAMMGELIRDGRMTQNTLFAHTERQLTKLVRIESNPLRALAAVGPATFPRLSRQLARLERAPDRIRRELSGGDPDPEPQLHRARREAYLTNQRSMAESCQAAGAAYLVLLQPQRPRPWRYSEFYAAIYTDFVAQADLALTAAGIEHIDLHADPRFEAEHFNDDIHFTPAGAALTARIVAPAANRLLAGP